MAMGGLVEFAPRHRSSRRLRRRASRPSPRNLTEKPPRRDPPAPSSCALRAVRRSSRGSPPAISPLTARSPSSCGGGFGGGGGVRPARSCHGVCAPERHADPRAAGRRSRARESASRAPISTELVVAVLGLEPAGLDRRDSAAQGGSAGDRHRTLGEQARADPQRRRRSLRSAARHELREPAGGPRVRPQRGSRDARGSRVRRRVRRRGRGPRAPTEPRAARSARARQSSSEARAGADVPAHLHLARGEHARAARRPARRAGPAGGRGRVRGVRGRARQRGADEHSAAKTSPGGGSRQRVAATSGRRAAAAPRRASCAGSPRPRPRRWRSCTPTPSAP